ncbi:MAG: hypothetical protein JWN86_4140 [Planctomycetota bacterium]|nr:hypothetical protein [Planctomycetota bacterium]
MRVHDLNSAAGHVLSRRRKFLRLREQRHATLRIREKDRWTGLTKGERHRKVATVLRTRSKRSPASPVLLLTSRPFESPRPLLWRRPRPAGPGRGFDRKMKWGPPSARHGRTRRERSHDPWDGVSSPPRTRRVRTFVERPHGPRTPRHGWRLFADRAGPPTSRECARPGCLPRGVPDRRDRGRLLSLIPARDSSERGPCFGHGCILTRSSLLVSGPIPQGIKNPPRGIETPSPAGLTAARRSLSHSSCTSSRTDRTSIVESIQEAPQRPEFAATDGSSRDLNGTFFPCCRVRSCRGWAGIGRLARLIGVRTSGFNDDRLPRASRESNGTFLLLKAIIGGTGQYRPATLAPTRSQARLHAQTCGGPSHPVLSPGGTVPTDREPDRLRFGSGHRRVDELRPTAATKDLVRSNPRCHLKRHSRRPQA